MRAKRTLAVGLIGYEFMGKVHSNAWQQAPRFFNLPADVQTKTICGRRRAAVKRAAATFGWANSVTDWREVVADPKIDIVDICTPNDTHCAKRFCAKNRSPEMSMRRSTWSQQPRKHAL